MFIVKPLAQWTWWCPSFFLTLFWMGSRHLRILLSTSGILQCVTKWISLNTSADTEACAAYWDVVNTQIFITQCQYYGDGKTQIIDAMYCGWSFGNIIISADEAAEISPPSTFPASQMACQTNPEYQDRDYSRRERTGDTTTLCLSAIISLRFYWCFRFNIQGLGRGASLFVPPPSEKNWFLPCLVWVSKIPPFKG